MPWIPLAAAGVSAIGGIISSNKAAKAAKEAAEASKVDINALDEQTRNIAKRNAVESAALEQQLTPEVAALRTRANQNVLGQLGNNTLSNLQGQVHGQLSNNLDTPLLNSAIAKAMQNLQLGGKLGVDQQNLVTRQALANAGSINQGGGLGLGRDLVARDLGVSSLSLERDRLAQASQLGGQQMELGQANNNNFMNRAALIQQLHGAGFGQNLAAAQFGQSIQQPIVGLDPTAIANVTVGNQTNQSRALANQANIQGAQGNNYMQFAGNLLGQGLQMYGNQPSQPQPVKYNAPTYGFGLGQTYQPQVTNSAGYGAPGKFGSY